MKVDKFIKTVLIVFAVNIFILFACSYALATPDIYRPIDFTDTAAYILVDMDASPSITYHNWQLPPVSAPEYDSLTLKVHRGAVEFADDRWIIRYSTDDGNSWRNMDLWARDADADTITANLDPLQDLRQLRVRIDTDKKKKADFGLVYIYDIRVEAIDYLDPSFTQSAYRFFKNVDSVDLSAIVSGVNGADEAKAIALHGNYIITAGYRLGDWYLEKRSKVDGSLVCSLEPGDDWCSVTVGDSWGEVKAIAIDDTDTHAIFIGNDYREGNYSWRIEKRRLDNLELVVGFGDGGVVISNPSNYHDSPHDIVIAGNHFYTIGEDRSYGELDAQWRIEKRNLDDGSLVGEATVINPSPYNDVPFAIATDGTYAYVVGYDRNTSPESARKPGKAKKITPDEQWRIEKRWLSDLSLAVDPVNSNPALGKSDVANDIAVDGSHMIVIGYECERSSYFDPMWRMERRRLSNLTIVTGFPPVPPVTEDEIFGGDGVVRQNYAPFYDDQPTAIAVDNLNNNMHIVGYSVEGLNGGDAAWRHEIRSLIDGRLVDEVVNDIDPDYNDRAYAIAIDGSDAYVAGYYNPGVPDLRIEKRDLDDLSPSFLQPLNDQDYPIPVTVGEAFRLRILLHVESGPLLQSGQQFKLQYGEENGACSVATYADVSDLTDIAFKNNPTALDGTALIVSSADPSHSGHITFEQTYEEQNGFTNSVSTIPIESDGMWDFSLYVNGAVSGDYCFRIVKDNGALLDGYDVYPEVAVTTP
jgi:hypothetical protein